MGNIPPIETEQSPAQVAPRRLASAGTERAGRRKRPLQRNTKLIIGQGVQSKLRMLEYVPSARLEQVDDERGQMRRGTATVIQRDSPSPGTKPNAIPGYGHEQPDGLERPRLGLDNGTVPLRHRVHSGRSLI